MILRFFLFCILLCSATKIEAESLSQIKSILPHFPEWKKFKNDVHIEPIEAGLTNKNFKISFPSKTYFVRICGKSKEILGLDALREVECTQQATALGIAPEVLFYNSEERFFVMPFIDSKPIEKNFETYAKMMPLLRLFHDSGKTLPTTFCPYGVISNYYQQALALRADHHIPLSAHLLKIVDEIRLCAPTFRKLVPCHLDLFYKNLLDDGKRMWIIDWEYGAMADPLYDLATCASSNYLTIEEMKELLALYLEEVKPQDFAYFYLMTILVDIRWGLWSLIQAEVSDIEVPYLDYADDAFYQALLKATHPQFKQSILILNSSDVR